MYTSFLKTMVLLKYCEWREKIEIRVKAQVAQVRGQRLPSRSHNVGARSQTHSLALSHQHPLCSALQPTGIELSDAEGDVLMCEGSHYGLEISISQITQNCPGHNLDIGEDAELTYWGRHSVKILFSLFRAGAPSQCCPILNIQTATSFSLLRPVVLLTHN